MKVFNAIMGILAVIASVYCFCRPGLTFLYTGWMVAGLLSVWGACALYNLLRKPSEGKKGFWGVAGAAAAVLVGIAAAVLSLIVMFRPGLSLPLDAILVYMFVFWMIVSGISSIVSAFTVVKAQGGSHWVWTLILGILTLIAGCYGIVHVLVMAQTIGLLIATLLMVYAVRLLGAAFE